MKTAVKLLLITDFGVPSNLSTIRDIQISSGALEETCENTGGFLLEGISKKQETSILVSWQILAQLGTLKYPLKILRQHIWGISPQEEHLRSMKLSRLRLIHQESRRNSWDITETSVFFFPLSKCKLRSFVFGRNWC